MQELIDLANIIIPALQTELIYKSLYAGTSIFLGVIAFVIGILFYFTVVWLDDGENDVKEKRLGSILMIVGFTFIIFGFYIFGEINIIQDEIELAQLGIKNLKQIIITHTPCEELKELSRTNEYSFEDIQKEYWIRCDI